MVERKKMNPRQRNILQRIKWKSVFLVLALFVITILIIIGFNPLNFFEKSYKGKGDIQERAWASPDTLDLKRGVKVTKIIVEVKNKGENVIPVEVKLKLRQNDIFFKDNETTQEISKVIKLGHSETREPNFDLVVNTTEVGTYCLDVFVEHSGEIIKDEVCLRVK